jgi:hypothetical protein
LEDSDEEVGRFESGGLKEDLGVSIFSLVDGISTGVVISEKCGGHK